LPKPSPFGLAHQRRQPLGTFAEVDRLGRHHHPDRAGRADHAMAFDARRTIVSVAASMPRPMRIFTPPISISIHCRRFRFNSRGYELQPTRFRRRSFCISQPAPPAEQLLG
jgi:hypothetical protein